MYKVKVDPDKCIGDEECIEVCPVNVLQIQNGRAFPYQAEECLGCGSCIEVCEPAAITVTEE